MVVHIPSPLFSYTARQAEVDAYGQSLADVLADLDRRYPGVRFRVVDEQDQIRPHIKFFVNGQIVRTLAHRLEPNDEIHIIAALSGGRNGEWGMRNGECGMGDAEWNDECHEGRMP